jgi:uncharacterized protein (DUF1330 family)
VYKNRGGAFFIVNKWHKPDVNGELSPKYLFEATNREEIERLIALESNIEILDEDALSTPPEAEEEAEPGWTVYLRLPSSLKSRIEAAARSRSPTGPGSSPMGAAVGATVTQYGGRFLVRGGATELIEGGPEPKRIVIIEFPDTPTLKRWYDSPEYQKILPSRLDNSTGRAFIVEA